VTTVTTESPGRSKLDRLEAQQHRLADRQQELLVYLRDSPEREAQLRAEWFEQHPTRLPDAVSAPGKEAERAQKAQRELDQVEKNLSALAGLLEVERAKQRELVTRRISAQAERYRQAERYAIRKAGETFAQLLEDFLAYKTAAETLNAWREGAAAEAGLQGDTLEGWRNDGGRHAIVPVPADVDAFVEMLLDVSLDAGGNGLRTDSSRRWDDFNELVPLTPDLREHAHAVVDVLRVQRRHATRRAALRGWSS
jgi:hypothetical protein